MEVEIVASFLVATKVLLKAVLSVLGMEVEIVASFLDATKELEALVDSVVGILHLAISKAVRQSRTQRVDTVQHITRRNRSNITADYMTRVCLGSNQSWCKREFEGYQSVVSSISMSMTHF